MSIEKSVISGIVWRALLAALCAYWIASYSQLGPIALVAIPVFCLLFWLLAKSPICLEGQIARLAVPFSVLFSLSMVLGRHIVVKGRLYDGLLDENYISGYGLGDVVAFAAIATGVYIVCAFVLMKLRACRAGDAERPGLPVSLAPVSPKRTVVCACVLLLMWLPYLLAYWPGVILNDTLASMRQFFGVQEWVNAQPAAYTWLLGTCLRFGEFLGIGATGGGALYTFGQMAAMALGLSFVSNWVVVRSGLGIRALVVIIMLFGMSSYIGSLSVALWKDPLFSVAIAVFTLLLFDWIWRGLRLSGLQAAAWFGLLTFAGLIRSNGVAISLLLLGAFVVLLIRRTFSWRLVSGPLVASALSIVVVVATTGPFYAALGISPAPKAEGYGIMVNQIARVVAYEGHMSEEDREYANSLLPIEEYRTTYAPGCVDPVKWASNFDNDALEREFFRHWLSIGLKNPRMYFEAWEMQTFGFWAVNSPEVNFYTQSVDKGVVGNETEEGRERIFRTSGIEATSLLPEGLSRLVTLDGWWIPVSWINWGMAFCCLCFLITGNRRDILGLLPPMGIALSLLIASPIWYWPRYGAAEQMLFPVLIALFYLLAKPK